MADVAVLGTGRMGAAMAERLAAAGHRLTVWNRTEATARRVVAGLPAEVAGAAAVAASPADAVRGRDVVLSMLADGDATCAVLLDTDVVAALRTDAIVCDLATSGVRAARNLAAGLGAAGVGFVDAPVSGSVPAVEAGTLLVMAAGDPAQIDAVRPVLEAFARRVVRVGDAGAGQAMKLAVNLVVHDLNAAVSEALILAEGSGITRESAYDVLQDSVVGAPFVAYKRAAFLDPATPVAMSLDLVLKDLRLITAHAHDVTTSTEVTAAAEAAVEAACAAGFGAQDMASLSRFLGIRRVS
ncbi:MAG: 3-hydroxyisobutyrate dehydrogenase [Actinomycetota bacterium]|jgi:3-hydroxyisobutyrate dehydrogenase-like beta-hydroxyacid dehydrogenase|nr:3-hydroxyisobutyrate dehydrogenase [Actinomycetota bacterium]